MQQKATLTKKQSLAISAVISSKNVNQGLKKININRSTWYRWLKKPHFKAELDRAKRKLVKSALESLDLATEKAVDVLKSLLNSDSESIKLKTATTILEFTERLVMKQELTDRIKELERKLI